MILSSACEAAGTEAAACAGRRSGGGGLAAGDRRFDRGGKGGAIGQPVNRCAAQNLGQLGGSGAGVRAAQPDQRARARRVEQLDIAVGGPEGRGGYRSGDRRCSRRDVLRGGRSGQRDQRGGNQYGPNLAHCPKNPS